MVFLNKYETISTQLLLQKNWREKVGVFGMTCTTTKPVCYPGSYRFLTIGDIGGSTDMAEKSYVIMEHKSIPKQVPLFEEQDDGNLTLYVKEI